MREFIKTIIVGNKHHEAGRLHNILSEHCPQLTVAGIASSVPEAEKLLSCSRPELAFMEMGFNDNDSKLINRLSDIDCNIIFTAPYNQYTFNTVPDAAIDCLQYPADITDITTAVSRAIQMHWLKQQMHKLSTKTTAIQPKNIALSNLNEIQFVPPHEIIRLEACNNYTHFFMDNGNKITVSHTLKHYEEMLQPYGFIRVHQSHIININKIRKYVKGKGGYLVMQDGQTINISAGRKEDLFRVLKLQ